MKRDWRHRVNILNRIEISKSYEGAKCLKWSLDFMSKIEGSSNTKYPNLLAFHSPLSKPW